ncbi:MAG: hypothetical protein L3J45_10795 [Flavobacteriaceae bacterium]|nr:hypothetical protein [Flavobacteriaceae bacterium]
MQLCLAQIQEAKTENNIKVILNSDGTWSYAKVNTSENTVILDKYTKWVNPKTDILKDRSNETYSIHKFIIINNGLKKPVSIKLLWKFDKEAPKISLKAINLIIIQANLTSKTFPKNPESYLPVGFSITHTKDRSKGVWALHSKFRGDNVYGQIGKFDKFFYFDKDGKLLTSK